MYKIESDMKKMIFIAVIFLSCIYLPIQGQEKKESPKGKAIIQVFGNFHSGFGESRNDRGFELDRSYLGYQYDLGNGLSIKAVMDIGQSNDVSDYQRIAYIKNAEITWKTGNFTLHGGMITTTQYNLQDKFWGNRYIYRSFQDLYKFGSSADLGISTSYELADWISVDAIIVNGEGFKKVQRNDGLLYGVGTIITPIQRVTLRLYGSLNESSEDSKEDITNFSSFIGYKNESFSIGAEYNMMQNYGNTKDQDLSGFSIYSNIKLQEKTQLFLRYDDISSKEDWNKTKDESALLAGVQFKLGKYVKLAPNFRMNIPKADGVDNNYMAYINFSFGF